MEIPYIIKYTKKYTKPTLLMNKEKKGWILIYPITQLPNRMTIEDVYNKIKKENKCYYDGTKGRNDKPRLINLGGNKNKKLLKTIFIDVSQSDISLIS